MIPTPKASTAKWLAFTSVAALSLLSPALAEDRAVVIGIDDYSALASGVSLKGAVRDAATFRDFLTGSWGFEPSSVTMLTNGDASSAAIMDAVIDRLIGETSPGDRAVFYFAGLGGRVDGDTVEADGKSEVLIAHDADSFLGKMPESVFADLFDLLEGRDVTVVIDASAAGDAALMAGAPGDVRSRGIALAGTSDDDRGEMEVAVSMTEAESFPERPFAAGKSERAHWSAAAPSQFAWEDGGGGVFTRMLTEAISSGAADLNGNGTLTNAELLQYMTDKMADWCIASVECEGSGLGLSPHFEGDVSGIVSQTDDGNASETGSDLREKAGTDLTGDATDSFENRLGFLSDIFAPNNEAGLKIRIDGSDPLKVGDTVRFQFRAEREGTLVLLDINPDGELAQVYPSALAPKDGTRMQPGEILTVPNAVSANGLPLEIRVTEPVGKGFLLALFVEDDLATLEATLPENLDGGPIPNATEYLFNIAQKLLEMQAGEEGNRPVDWSAIYLPYEIVQ